MFHKYQEKGESCQAYFSNIFMMPRHLATTLPFPLAIIVKPKSSPKSLSQIKFPNPSPKSKILSPEERGYYNSRGHHPTPPHHP